MLFSNVRRTLYGLLRQRDLFTRVFEKSFYLVRNDVEPLDGANALAALKEQRERAGTDVRAGDRFVIDEKDLLRRMRAALDEFNEHFRVLAARRVRDSDRLIFGVDDVLLIL